MAPGRSRTAGTLLALGLFFLPALLLGTLQAQDNLQVAVSLHPSHTAIPAGGSGVLGIVLDIPAGHHIQVNEFLSAQIVEPEGIDLGLILYPPPQSYEGDPVYTGRLLLKTPLLIGADLAPGSQKIKVLVEYQICAEEPIFMCFPPDGGEFELSIEILPAALTAVLNSNPAVTLLDLTLEDQTADAAADDAGGDSGSLAGRVEKALAQGSWVAFLLIFLGGVAMSFTPCLYPMIPITISFIGGRSKGKLSGFILSLFFVLGIALTYSILGVLAAQTGALFGSAMQSTPVLLLVAAVLFIMGISMLGAFDIALSSSAQTRLQGGARRGGFLGAILMGMVTGLVASPCVGPVVIVLLTWIAKAGNVFLGFWLMFTFAVGMGMLFLLLGTFAGAINALPKSGVWMATVKHVFGVMLIAMGLYYVKPLIGDTNFKLLVGAFTIFVATFTGAFHRLAESPSWGSQFRKGLGMILFVVGIYLLLLGLLQAGNVQLVGAGGGAATPQIEAEPDWVMSDEEGLILAMESGRPVLIDFYADWCGACRELDEKTWIDPAVMEELERFIVVKLDFTDRTPAQLQKQTDYGVRGLPTVILLDSDGEEIIRFAGFKEPEDVLELLRGIE